jgi:hypothetical protein
MTVLKHDTYSELISIADNELERLKTTIPDDPSFCFAVLLEATRMYDFLHFGDKEIIEKYGLSFQVVDVLKSGWNLAVSFLFKRDKSFTGIPAMESTGETIASMISLLYQFGCVTLIQRTAEMVKSGILLADFISPDSYNFTMSPDGKLQFLDQMELSYLENLEDKIETIENTFYKNWKLSEHESVHSALKEYGSFLSKRPKDQFASLKLTEVETKMLSLLKPWDSGKGIMIEYGSSEELDWHFMAIAATAMEEFIDESGIDPDIYIENIKASDLISIVTCLVSVNLKHIEFSRLASKEYNEVSRFQTLTIWCSLSKLIKDISDFMGMDKNIVKEVFKVISFKAQDAVLLRKHTTKFMPLIIDLENDFILRPVSSIIRNPLNTTKDLMVLRNPRIVSELIKGREVWLRGKLYGLFMGARYFRVEGNIALRINKKFVTDIDAAIYDNLTGELALFQIKWQDYHFNDIKKLRSRGKNLTEELDKWTRKVVDWISSQGLNKLSQNLRLSNDHKVTDSKIYLLGLSKNAARMKGYGFELQEKRIAICTWAQFLRNRVEVGPSDSVFGDLFKVLKEQEDWEVSATPKPVTFKMLNKEFHYDDLWNVCENKI